MILAWSLNLLLTLSPRRSGEGQLDRSKTNQHLAFMRGSLQISKRLITGKAKYIIWPPVRAGRVSDHHTSGSSSRTNVVPGAASLPAEFLE